MAVDASMEEQALVEWQGNCAHKHEGWHAAVAHARVAMAMDELSKQHQGCIAGLIETM